MPLRTLHPHFPTPFRKCHGRNAAVISSSTCAASLRTPPAPSSSKTDHMVSCSCRSLAPALNVWADEADSRHPQTRRQHSHVSETLARWSGCFFSPMRAFRRVDLPTLDLPTRATSGRWAAAGGIYRGRGTKKEQRETHENMRARAAMFSSSKKHDSQTRFRAIAIRIPQQDRARARVSDTPQAVRNLLLIGWSLTSMTRWTGVLNAKCSEAPAGGTGAGLPLLVW